MVLVPANMSCFGFSPGNFFFVFRLCKIFCFWKQSLRDLFKNQKILQGLFF